MGFDVTVEGLDELLAVAERETDRFERAMRNDAVERAASEGVLAVVRSHPYTDRTSNLTQSLEAVPVASTATEPEAEMVAGEFYASFVNRRPRFNFIKRAEEAARKELDASALRVSEDFCDRMNR